MLSHPTDTVVAAIIVLVGVVMTAVTTMLALAWRLKHERTEAEKNRGNAAKEAARQRQADLRQAMDQRLYEHKRKAYLDAIEALTNLDIRKPRADFEAAVSSAINYRFALSLLAPHRIQVQFDHTITEYYLLVEKRAEGSVGTLEAQQFLETFAELCRVDLTKDPETSTMVRRDNSSPDENALG